MEIRETPVTPSFLGFVKKAPCPVCGTVLAKSLGTAGVLCSGCGDYSVFGDKTLRRMDADSLRDAPAFAAPTPWPDLQAPTFGALKHPVAALDDLLRTNKEAARLLDARWPEGCCVCGKPSVRGENLAQQVGFSPPNGLKPRQSKETVVIARGVPHCAEHQEGARFERVIAFGDADISVLGLFFRSYAYQIKFRAMNPWKWRG